MQGRLGAHGIGVRGRFAGWVMEKRKKEKGKKKIKAKKAAKCNK